jgi:multisubunit Na+/H+ antiporter MnhC subunit
VSVEQGATSALLILVGVWLLTGMQGMEAVVIGMGLVSLAAGVLVLIGKQE